MAGERILENLVVRLLGDPKGYLRALGDAERATAQSAAKVEKTWSGARKRMAAAEKRSGRTQQQGQLTIGQLQQREAQKQQVATRRAAKAQADLQRKANAQAKRAQLAQVSANQAQRKAAQYQARTQSMVNRVPVGQRQAVAATRAKAQKDLDAAAAASQKRAQAAQRKANAAQARVAAHASRTAFNDQIRREQAQQRILQAKQRAAQKQMFARKDLQAAGRDLQAAEEAAQSSLQTWKQLGSVLMRHVVQPILAVAGAGVRAFGEFETSIIEATSVLEHKTGPEMERIRQQAISLSSQFTQTATEMGEGLFFLASAGKNARQSMAALPVIVKFATAASFDLGTATDQLIGSQNALGMSTKDVTEDMKQLTRIGDVLTKANALAQASVSELSTSLSRQAAATFRNFNKEVEEGVALLALYAKQNIKGSQAGTLASRFVRLLGTSAIKNAEAHKRFGFSVFNSAGKMRNFADIADNMTYVLRGMSEEAVTATLKQLGFDARIQQAIFPIIGMGNELRMLEYELRKAGGSMERMSQEKLAGFGARMKVAGNQVKNVGVLIGKELAPAVLVLTNILTGLVNWFANLDKQTRAVIIVTTMLVAVITPMVVVIGLIVSGIRAYSAILVIAGVKTEVMTLATLKMKAAMIAARVAAAGLVAFIGYHLVMVLTNARGAMRDLKKEMDISAELQKQLEKRYDKTTESIKRQFNAITDAPKQRSFLTRQLLAAQKEAEGLVNVVNHWNKVVADSEGIGAALLGGTTDVEAARQELAGAEANLERVQKLIETLEVMQERLAKARPGKVLAFEDVIDIEEEASEVEKLNESIDELTKKLRLEVGAYGMSSRAAELYELKTRKATDAQLKEAETLSKTLEQWDRYKEMMEEGQNITEEFRTPLEKFNDRMEELRKYLDAGVISQETFGRATQGASKDLKEAGEEAKKTSNEIRGLDATLAGSNEARVRLYEQQEALRKSFQEMQKDRQPLPNVANPNQGRGQVADRPSFDKGYALGLNIYKVLQQMAKKGGVQLNPADFNI